MAHALCHLSVATLRERATHHVVRGLRAWWGRNVVAMDPRPEAGPLDQLDPVWPGRATHLLVDEIKHVA